MAMQAKISILVLVIMLTLRTFGAEGRDVKRSRGSAPPALEEDSIAGETQQVSLITTLEYMPVEARKFSPQESGYRKGRGESILEGGEVEARNVSEKAIDRQQGSGIKSSSRSNKAEWRHHKVKVANNPDEEGLDEDDESSLLRQKQAKKSEPTQREGQKKARAEAGAQLEATEGKVQGNGNGEGSIRVARQLAARRGKTDREPVMKEEGDLGQLSSSPNVVSETVPPIFGRRRKAKLGTNVQRTRQAGRNANALQTNQIGKVAPGKATFGRKRKRKVARPVNIVNKHLSRGRNRNRIPINKMTDVPKKKNIQAIPIPMKKIASKHKNNVPVSIFIRSNEIGKNNKGHLEDRQKLRQKLKKNPLRKQDNEIHDEGSRDEKHVSNTILKSTIVSKPTFRIREKDSSESKQRPKILIAVPTLKTQRSRQVSAVAEKGLKPLASGKRSKPKSYKTSGAHESSHHKTTGGSVEKGDNQSSGYKHKELKDHGKSHSSKFEDKGKQEYSGHKHKEGYDGHFDGGKKASKGHAHGEKGHHHKGHSDKGFKDVHHKLEYGTKENFYHDNDDKNYHEVFDEFDAMFARKKQENLKAHEFHGGHHHHDHGHEGHSFDEFFQNHMKELKKMYGRDGHHDHYHDYGHEKHHHEGDGYHNHHDGKGHGDGHNAQHGHDSLGGQGHLSGGHGHQSQHGNFHRHGHH